MVFFLYMLMMRMYYICMRAAWNMSTREKKIKMNILHCMLSRSTNLMPKNAPEPFFQKKQFLVFGLLVNLENNTKTPMNTQIY